MVTRVSIFEALSSHIRRRILLYLSQGDLKAGEISERFDISKPTVSRHLSVLEHAELITSVRKGQFVYYHLNRDHLVSNMYDFLADFCPCSRRYKKESLALSKNKKGSGKGGKHGRS